VGTAVLPDQQHMFGPISANCRVRAAITASQAANAGPSTTGSAFSKKMSREASHPCPLLRRCQDARQLAMAAIGQNLLKAANKITLNPQTLAIA